jgi:peptidyl-prolyl cis-trans isomerase C
MSTQSPEPGCTVKPAISTAPRKVSVNGTVLSRAAIARETQNHPSDTPIEAWKAAARALVVRELLLQEARRLGVPAEPARDEDGRRETDEEAMMRALVEREVVTPVPDETTCRRYYEMNRARFRSPGIVEASHILIAARPDDAQARATACETAAMLIGELAADSARFAELARAWSACPSAATGGNLGQILPGTTVPEFEAALAALAPGETSAKPVETRYGVHVVRLERRIEGRDLPFELVAGRIADYLAERSRRTALAQYLARLAARAEVVGVDLPVPADLNVH